METRAPAKLATPEVTVEPAPGAAAPQGKELAGRGLLDAVLQTTRAAPTPAAGALEEFLAECDPWRALAHWLTRSGATRARPTRDEVGRVLARDIARLDDLLSRQVNAILHHPCFQ